jgi:hypothetical protein
MARRVSLSIALLLTGLAGCTVPYQTMEPFASKEGNFRCVFPGGNPSWRVKPWSFPPIMVAEGFNPGIEYAAGYGDAPDAPKGMDLPKIYTQMRDKIVADFKGTLLYTGEIWIDGYRGTEFVMQLPGENGRLCKMRAMFAGKRAFMFGVVASKPDLNHPDVHKFFASFQVIDKPAVVLEPRNSRF